MKTKKYEKIISELEYSMNKDYYYLSNISNFTAIIYKYFNNISWIGFYLDLDLNLDNNYLYLGPFQGNPACAMIKKGNGVCGTSYKNNEILNVENVHNFKGHIACDSRTNSELVIPFNFGKIKGVLDLDSYKYNYFNDIDIKYLKKALDILKNNIFN